MNVDRDCSKDNAFTVAGCRGAICIRNGRSNFVFVRGVVSSTFALVYKENKTLYPAGRGVRGVGGLKPYYLR